MINRRTFLTATLALSGLAGVSACSTSTTSAIPSSQTSSGTSSDGPGGPGGGGGVPQPSVSVDPDLVAAFQQSSFTDPATGDTLAYNLFTPKAYDGTKSYPLVLFMEDASAVGGDTTTALTQGIGALCWASAGDQSQRPCFVLAPQYDSVVVNDNSESTSLLDTTVHLVQSLAGKLKIDTNRLYTTGQSMGGMMSIAIDIKYPDLFAASYLVACQWDAAKVGPMVNDKLWITVSEGDTKAYPGQNAILAALKADGASYSHAQLGGSWSDQKLSDTAAALAAKGTAINYTTFKTGTLPGTAVGAMEHMATWTRAYSIESIREWIFQQHK